MNRKLVVGFETTSNVVKGLIAFSIAFALAPRCHAQAQVQTHAPTEVANPVQTGLSAGFNGSAPDRDALGTTRDSLLPRSPVKHLGSRLADRKMLIDWAGIFETPPD